MKLQIIALCMFAGTLVVSCNQSSNKQISETTNDTVSKQSKAKLQIYYFHLTNRCITCNSIEANVKSVIESTYSEEIKQGLISFESINIQEKENWEIAEQYETANASLFLTLNTESGQHTSDLTSQAFMLSKNKPDEFKQLIQDTIKSLIK